MTFDPRAHLSQLSRKQRQADGSYRQMINEYLEVKWRIAWCRDVAPEAVIETELVEHTGTFSLFRARVSLPSGAVATGWGSETEADWKDHLEKAETKALGRALAALGFGTQFCDDFDFGGGDQARVVDAPVSRPTQPGATLAGPTTHHRAEATHAPKTIQAGPPQPPPAPTNQPSPGPTQATTHAQPAQSTVHSKPSLAAPTRAEATRRADPGLAIETSLADPELPVATSRTDPGLVSATAQATPEPAMPTTQATPEPATPTAQAPSSQHQSTSLDAPDSHRTQPTPQAGTQSSQPQPTTQAQPPPPRPLATPQAGTTHAASAPLTATVGTATVPEKLRVALLEQGAARGILATTLEDWAQEKFRCPLARLDLNGANSILLDVMKLPLLPARGRKHERREDAPA